MKYKKALVVYNKQQQEGIGKNTENREREETKKNKES